MGTHIFYQADVPAAWMQLPLLRREPRDSKQASPGLETPKAKKATLTEGVAIACEAAAGGAHA